MHNNNSKLNFKIYNKDSSNSNNNINFNNSNCNNNCMNKLGKRESLNCTFNKKNRRIVIWNNINRVYNHKCKKKNR
jgi:hypothetical protein